MMNKDRRKMTEKILNYALEIIFVLTGEEYTIVKKNSPHCSIDQLSGEVPIKCDNVAVYFSMEEWEYIEGHKELYEDMLMGSHQACKTVKTPSNDSGFHDTSARAAKADSRNKMDIQMVETHADTSADENIADIVSNVDQTEEQSTRSHPKNEENVFENVCTVSSRCDEKLDTVWISDGEEDKCENNVQPEEVHPHSCTDGAIGLNMFCEPAVWDSSEDVVEDDTGLCNKDQGEDLEINPTIDLNIRNEVNLPSTSTSYQCTQTPCPQNENFVTDYSGATVGIWEVKKEEDTDCSKLTSRTSVCEDHQAPSTHEKHCTSNKNRKRVSSGSKLHVDKTPQTDRLPSWKMSEQKAAWDSSKAVETDTSISQQIKAEGSNEMDLRSDLIGNPASTSMSYEYEQASSPQTQLFNDYSGATFGTWDVKKEASTDCSSNASRIGQQAPHPAEKLHASNRDRKQVTSEAKNESHTAQTDGSISWNMFGEQASGWDTSEEIMEGDSGLSKMQNSHNDSIFGGLGNLSTTAVAFQCKQMLRATSDKFVSDSNDTTFSSWDIKKEEITDDAKNTSSTAVCEDQQARSAPEKLHTSHKIRKPVTSETKMNVSRKSHTDGPISWNMFCEPVATCNSAVGVMEDNASTSKSRCSTNEASFCDNVNLASTSMSYNQSEQTLCPESESFVNSYSDLRARTLELKKKKNTKANSRIAVCEDQLGEHLMSNKNRKSFTSESEMYMNRKLQTDRPISWNMLGHQRTGWNSSEGIMENDTSASKRVQGEDSEGNSAKDQGHLASTLMTYQCPQTGAQSDWFVNDCNNTTLESWNAEKEESSDCGKQTGRTAACEDHLAQCAKEKPRNKKRKQCPSESKMNTHKKPHRDFPMNLNMFRELVCVSDSSDGEMEEDQNISKTIQAEDFEKYLDNDPALCDKQNLAPASLSYHSEQTSYPQNEKRHNNCNKVKFRIWEAKSEDSTDCVTRSSRTVASEEHLEPSASEKPHRYSRHRKRLSPGDKRYISRSQAGETAFGSSEHGRPFAHISHLITQQGIYTNKKPYVCRLCGKNFSKRSILVSHHRTHTGEKPHVCSYCGWSFTKSSNLIRHQRTHTGEKPYVCSDCGRCFTRRQYLVAHQRLHTDVMNPYIVSTPEVHCQGRTSLFPR